MVYVVERYLPGLTRSDLLRGLSRLEQLAERREGPAARYLGSTIVLEDEACFCQFEGPSEAAVAEANREAGLPFNRIVPAVTVTPDERRSPMSISTPVPATIEVKRSRLVGGAIAVAALAAAVTWAVLSFAVDNGSEAAQVVVEQPGPVTISMPAEFPKSISHTAQMQQAAQLLHALGLSPKSTQYVLAMSSLSPVEQAAAFGGPGAVLDALDLNPMDRLYVRGITSMTLEEQAAAFGGPSAALRGGSASSSFKRFAEGVSSLAKAQQTAAVLDALGLDAKSAQYVMGIAMMTPAEQAAAFGR